MKKRLRKKLEKKNEADSNSGYTLLGSEADCYFAIVKANVLQLYDVGIDDDLTEKKVKVLKHYKTGYAQIVGTPHPILKTEQLWDIPLRYLAKL